jgi:hypothetical protein
MTSETSMRRIWKTAMWSAAVTALLCGRHAMAQRPSVHYLHRSDMPPGMVGQQQLLRSPTLIGYFQPVEVLVPPRVHVSLMIDGGFDAPRPGPVLAGMQVGHVYQLKITNIPYFEGAELYPTIELVNRLYPPPEAEKRYPIPVELTREEMEMALDGLFVTRVIYLEDSSNALPLRDDPRHQRFTEAGPEEDPLHVADRLGRPMAILRMGSRVPEGHEQSGVPGTGSPPIQVHAASRGPAARVGTEGRAVRAVVQDQSWEPASRPLKNPLMGNVKQR